MRRKVSKLRTYSTLLLSAALALGIAIPQGAVSANAAPILIPEGTAIQLGTELTKHNWKEIAQNGSSSPSMLKAATAEKPQNFVERSSSSDPVTVIVELQSLPLKVFEAKAPLSARSQISSYSSVLNQEHTKFKSAASLKLGAQFHREYSKVFNGYSITLPANEVDSLLDLPGVKAVYPNEEFHALPIADGHEVTPNMDESAPLIGAPTMWNLGIDGKGIKVGVIDTGIDYNHPSLKGAYKGGYDFVDNDPDPMETKPDPSKPDIDGNSYNTEHGTHVSGTIVGQGDPEHPDAGKGWVRGVAPGADLYVYRVLGPYGRGSTENVIAGIERAVSDGLDVINLSLGSKFNNEYSPDAIAVDNATLAGVTVVVSNGNEGPGEETVGSPAAGQLPISVGASTPPLQTPIFTSDSIGIVYSQLAATSSKLDMEGETLDLVPAGIGRNEDFTADVTGKVALIERGTLSFAEKSQNAAAHGAIAAIIYNNVPGDIGGATLSDAPDTVPTYTISQESGKDLVNAVKGGHSQVTFSYKAEQDLLADLSSRGPSLPNYLIKPDIAAPGVGIRSSIPAFDGNYDNAYEDLQGTSMAAPHVAGSAVLMLEQARDRGIDLQPEQVKALLMNNAKLIHDRNDRQYAVNEQGAGRVDLTQASEAKAIVKVLDQLPPQLQSDSRLEAYSGSISFGQQGAGSDATKKLVIDNIGSVAQTYQVDVNWNTNSSLSLTPASSSVSLGAGQASTELPVTLNIPAGTPDGLYEGNVLFTEATTGHQLHVPFSVYVGDTYDLDEITNVELDPMYLSPNGDGHGDTSKIYYALNKKVDDYAFIVFDYFTLTPIGTIYDEDKTKDARDPFYYSFDWDGTVYPLNSPVPKKQTLEEGVYGIVPYLLDTNQLIGDTISPFLVDTTAPEINLFSDEIALDPDKPNVGIIQGEIVDDMLLDYLYDGSNLIADFVHVKAGVGEPTDPNYKEYDGVIDEYDGTFSVEVPLNAGENTIQLYVYDDAGNGLTKPAHTYKYDTTSSQLNLSASKKEVKPGEAFDVNVGFSVTDAVYSASFTLTYDDKLTLSKITPGVTGDVYSDPADTTTDQDIQLQSDSVPGKKQATFKVDLSEPLMTGTFAQFTFSGTEVGNYPFEITDVSLLNEQGDKIPVNGRTPVMVQIVKETPPDPGNGGNPGGGGGSGGNGSGSGGSAPSTPSTPPANKAAAGSLTEKGSGDQKTAVLSVDTAYITSQLSNKDAKSVTIDISDTDVSAYHPLTIQMSSALSKQLQESKKDLIIKGKGFEILIPSADIASFLTKAGLLSISISLDASPKGAVQAPTGGSGTFVSSALTIQETETALAEPIVITLDLDGAKVKDRQKVSAFMLGKDEAWTYAAAGNNKAKSISFPASKLGSFSAAEVNKSFTDTLTHWAKKEIEVIASHYLAEGKDTTDTYKPSDHLTQAEFMTLLDRLLGTGKTWSDRAAETGASHALSREEVAVLLAEALKADLTKVTTQLSFKDKDKISENAAIAIAYAVENGYLQGNPDHSFNPKGNLTRAEAAVILYRVLQHLQNQ